MKKINLLICVLLLVTVSAFKSDGPVGISLKLKWTTDASLKVPESVLFDPSLNILFVSNIDGKPGEKDGMGSISKVTLDGKIESGDWVKGLDAPKGMGLYKGMLYVADLTRIVVIDVKASKISKSIEIDGAKFLNDITVDSKGHVFASDSDTGTIYELVDGKASKYFESAELKRVNGLLSIDKGLYVVDAGTGVNYKLSADKKLVKFSETSQGADGIISLGKDEYIVSSWGGEIYFVDAKGASTKILDTKEQKLNSADIWYSQKNNLLFIPTFFGNTVAAYEIVR